LEIIATALKIPACIEDLDFRLRRAAQDLAERGELTRLIVNPEITGECHEATEK
jgi:hypothetical protein